MWRAWSRGRTLTRCVDDSVEEGDDAEPCRERRLESGCLVPVGVEEEKFQWVRTEKAFGMLGIHLLKRASLPNGLELVCCNGKWWRCVEEILIT